MGHGMKHNNPTTRFPILSRNSQRRERNELQIKFLRLFGQLLLALLSVLPLIVLQPFIHVLATILEQPLDQAREIMSEGGNRVGAPSRVRRRRKLVPNELLL